MMPTDFLLALFIMDICVSALTNSLARWPGKAKMQDLLSDAGFILPKIYQETVINYCGNEARSNLEKYWSEIAQEHIAGSPINSDSRNFKSSEGYRSIYLDELAKNADTASESMFKAPPLDICMRRFLTHQYQSHDFALQLTARLEASKDEEIISHNISDSGWSGKKRGALELASGLLLSLGFSRSSKSAFVKKTMNGLIFTFLADTGGRSICISLPFSFYIAHESDPDTPRQVNINTLTPGFSYYGIFKSPKSAVLGIAAYITAFSLLFDMLS